MRKHIDGQELEDATVSFMTAVTRRAKIVSLIIFGMLAAGIGAKFFGGVVTYFGLEEKWSELAMAVGFLAALIGGAWVYDHGK